MANGVVFFFALSDPVITTTRFIRVFSTMQFLFFSVSAHPFETRYATNGPRVQHAHGPGGIRRPAARSCRPPSARDRTRATRVHPRCPGVQADPSHSVEYTIHLGTTRTMKHSAITNPQDPAVRYRTDTAFGIQTASQRSDRIVGHERAPAGRRSQSPALRGPRPPEPRQPAPRQQGRGGGSSTQSLIQS